MNLQVAAAAILQGMTAHYLCTSTYPVREGDIAVVHAAAGGVGLLLTQMVKRRGGVVVGTTSGGEKVELALQAGADHVVGYDRFRDIVDEASDGAGAHVVYDGVGQDTFDDGLAEVFDWITKGELDVRIGGTYPLSEAARAQEDLAGRRTTGKLLLLPGL